MLSIRRAQTALPVELHASSWNNSQIVNDSFVLTKLEQERSGKYFVEVFL